MKYLTSNQIKQIAFFSQIRIIGVIDTYKYHSVCLIIKI